MPDLAVRLPEVVRVRTVIREGFATSRAPVVVLTGVGCRTLASDILTPFMSLAPGTTLGPYEIVSQLGQGGMGVVYQAHDPRLDRHVAIKLLPPDLTRDETAKQRFLQEAKAASALDHPNICTIHEINETDDGQLYLVMAHYEGETLKERIARGPLVLDDAIDIATQVGQGLAEAEAELHKAQPTPPGCHFSVGMLGYYYGRGGKTDDAQHLLTRLQDLSKTTYIPALSFGMTHIGMNDTDLAFDRLHQAYEERNGALCWLPVEPTYDPLRSDPRFHALLQRMNFPAHPQS